MSDQTKPDEHRQQDEEAEDETDVLGISFRKSKPPSPAVKKNDERESFSLPEKVLPVVQAIDDDYYKTTHKNRGLALIFNHYEFDQPGYMPRKGTDKDCRRVKETFQALGFETIVHQDLKYGRIALELEKASAKDHSESDCLVVVVMTHGDPDILHARDQAYHTAALWEPFTGDNCPTLVGKPKLFFIQACRGTDTDDGVQCQLQFDGSPAEKPVIIKIPKMADFLIMYATQPGNYSFRSPMNGSWFIQTLCDQLEKRAKEMDLNGILTIVNRTMAYNYASNVPTNRDLHDKKQIGQIVTSLTRLLHFHRT